MTCLRRMYIYLDTRQCPISVFLYMFLEARGVFAHDGDARLQPHGSFNMHVSVTLHTPSIQLDAISAISFPTTIIVIPTPTLKKPPTN
jgi:hypothetical protein